jgi:hypothetical protein
MSFTAGSNLNFIPGSGISITGADNSTNDRVDITIAGSGSLPSGGTIGQVLEKNSSTDFDTSWQTPSGGGGSLLSPSPPSALTNWTQLDAVPGHPSTFIDFNGGLYIGVPTANGTFFGAGLALPLSLAVSTVTEHVLVQAPNDGGSGFGGWLAGMFFYDSVTGKVCDWGIAYEGIYCAYSGIWNNITSFSGSNYDPRFLLAQNQDGYWRMKYDGTNFIISFSQSGLAGTFIVMKTSSAPFVPTHAGFHTGVGSSIPTSILLDYYSVTYP